jgi:hypothetical protein
MSNCLFAWPDYTINTTGNYFDSSAHASVSGGNWSGLNRLQDDALGTKANSVDLNPASTRFIVNLCNGDPVDVKVIALIGLNAQDGCQVRVRAHSAAANISFDDIDLPVRAEYMVFDSGVVDFWSPYYPQGSLPWGHPSLWDGGLVPLEDLINFPRCKYFVLPNEWAAQATFVMVEIFDQHNTEGHVSLSRCFVAPAWQPPLNMLYGAQMGWDDSATSVVTSRGGVDYFEENPKHRVCNFTLETTSPVARTWFSEMQRKLGKSKELFFIFDPDDVSMVEQTASFLAYMRNNNPFTFQFFDNANMQFQLKEKL